MSKSQYRYFLERAQTSLEMAKRATNPAVARVHMNFYKNYSQKAQKAAEKFTIAVPVLL